ncbi:MAG: DUF6089 family protein [Bacteroidota bacterium]
MKHIGVFIWTLFLMNTSLSAQKYFELGGFIGFAGYQGDLTEDPIDIGETKYSFGGFAKYHYNRKLHLRGQLYYGRISGADANSTSQGLRNRDWSFTADLAEVSIAMEILPFGKSRIDRVGLFRPQINPFISFGIGLTFTNEEIDYEHNPFNSMGKRISFPEANATNNFLVIPAGAGLRFDFTQWTTLAGEFGFRYTQSDYVDGISENALAAGPDWYFFVGVTLSTYFGQQEDYGLD